MAPSRINDEVRGFALLLWAIALLSSYSANVEGARRGLGSSDASVFDVTQYGAKADGRTDSAPMFVSAWNAACQASGAAKVLIPSGTFLAGEVIFQGPCKCASPLIIEVQGTLLAKTQFGAYPNGQWFLIERVDGVSVVGKGTFNGQGEGLWKFNDRKTSNGSPSTLLPITIKFDHVNNSRIEGITLLNSQGFHLKITSSNNVTAQGLTITAPGESPNTDGIHISRSDLVNVSDSVIGTGDDCISIGEGSSNIGISGITCGPGHGISIGSLGKLQTENDVKGVVVRNCTLANTQNGVRIKTFQDSPKIQASGISFEDIIMKDVENPILIDQHYMSKDKKGPSNVKLSDIHYKNIRGTTVSTTAVALNCSEAVPCEGIEVADIDLTYSGISTKSIADAAKSVADSAKSIANSAKSFADSASSILSDICSNAKATFTGKQNPQACT